MPRITEMYAFIQEDMGPDDEGIIAFLDSDGVWNPMVGADTARINSLRKYAQVTANATGKPVKLVHFMQRTDGELIEPIYDRRKR